MINSALLTAQMRKRLYWTNIPNIQQPQDKGVVLKDIIESGGTERLKSYCITATYSRACPEDYFNHGQRQLIFKKPVRVGHFNKGGQGDRIYSVDGKSVCLSANGGGRGAKTGLYEIKDLVRKLTPNECARLQGFPDNYCNAISNSQAYKCYGNSFTVPVVKHILQNLFLEV
jgi:site-specific DNA-cytosine methylase